MQATTLAPRPTCCSPIPNHFRFQSQNHRPKRRLTAFLPSQNQTHFLETPLLNLSTTNCCSIKQEKNKKSENQSCSNPKSAPSKELYIYTDDTSQIRITQNQKQGKKEELQRENNRVIFTNMWWADLKAALGQRINVEGIVSSVLVFTRDRHLAVPHVVVPDIRYIDWAELHRRGFKGVVFDKDNTLTAPYSLTLWGPLRSSLEQCKSLFGSNIAVFSNSAGLSEYDHDGSKARTLEKAVGIKVLRHRVKKPAGTAEEIEEHFGCESSKLIMVGDRPFIDIVYGNRNGFLTILTEPLALTEEPFIVTQVRKLETSLVNQWCRRGLKPVSHNLLPDVQQCVKDSTSL